MKTPLASVYFIVVTALTSNYASATQNFTITVPAPLTRSDTLQIQSKLNSIRDAGGGTLTLSAQTPTASVLVVETNGLQVYSGTTLQGDPAKPQMVLIGENSSGFNYRRWPVISVSSSSNVVIYNLDIEGGTQGRPLSPYGTGALAIANSSNVQVVTDTIAGVRTFGIAIWSSSYVTIQYLVLTMGRQSSGEPEGGAGIWCSGCQNAQLTQSQLRAFDYFYSGVPSDPGLDPRLGMTPPPTAFPVTDPRGPARSMVLVEFSDGSNNTFDNNTFSYTNTAAIYLFPGTINGLGENSDVIWNNQIAYFRQNGLDIDKCTNCNILTNTIATYVELSAINFARSTCDNSAGHGIRYNVLDKGGNWKIPNNYPSDYGALSLAGSTLGCTQITGNYIHGGNNLYPVYFFQWNGGQPSGNVVTGNNLWPGIAGPSTYFNGNYVGWNTSNTISPNTLH